MRASFHPDIPFRPGKAPFFYGWWILVVSSIGIIASIPGQTMGFSVFTPILSEALGLTSSLISTAYLVGTVMGGLMLPKVGKCFDQLGARVLGTLVCVVMGVGLLYLSQVDRLANQVQASLSFLNLHEAIIPFIAIALGFFWLRFTGQGTLTMTSRSMLGKWFNHYRGIAISISGIMVSFSFSIAPRMLDLSIQSVGWRGTWFWLGILMIFVMSLFVWLFYRDNPEECGLYMDGSQTKANREQTNDDLIIYREFTREEALRTAAFWIFNLAIGLHVFVITGYTFHIVSIADDLGIEKSTILQAFVPASILGIIISLIAGSISSKIRLKWMLSLLPLGGLIFTLGPVFEFHQPQWFIITGLGTAGGIFGIVSGMVWPRFFGREHLGAISGVNMATMVYGSAAAPLCFSLSYDWFGSYHLLFAAMAVLYLLCLISCFWADNPQRKLKPAN